MHLSELNFQLVYTGHQKFKQPHFKLLEVQRYQRQQKLLPTAPATKTAPKTAITATIATIHDKKRHQQQQQLLRLYQQ